MTKEITKTSETAQEEVILTPTEYFDMLKGKREEAKLDDLQSLYDNACSLIERYKITGQKAGAVKLYNFALLCEKEIKAVHAGINTYINRKDLDEYITNVAQKTVVIIELENFERDLPDDVIDTVAKLKQQEIFDVYYVVFSDYTGKERKKVEQKRRDKDPILFGGMKIGNQINTRLYYIASWEDEYCDLTLDKMVKEFSKKHKNTTITHDIKKSYATVDELREAFGDSTKSELNRK